MHDRTPIMPKIAIAFFYPLCSAYKHHYPVFLQSVHVLCICAFKFVLFLRVEVRLHVANVIFGTSANLYPFLSQNAVIG